jgi:hypothetical protein
MGDNAGEILNVQRGGFASRGVGVYYDLGLFDTLAIAAHEGWHQYTQRTFRNPLPTYLEEGLAAYMEGHGWVGATPIFRPWSNLERYDALVRIERDGGVASLHQLVRERPGQLAAGGGSAEALRYYAQVWALVHFLNEGEGGAHRGALRLLLDDAASGRLRQRLAERFGPRRTRAHLSRRLGAETLELYFGSIDDLDRAYRQFVAAITQPGDRSSVARGVSPAGGP